MIDLERRFLLGTLALSPVCGSAASAVFTDSTIDERHLHALASNLLLDWCEGMLAHQIELPADPQMHGALWCPACQKIHGRCMDAVFPFIHMYKRSGDKRYLTAAIRVMEWADKNVTLANGAWTVIPDPKSWPGITVFGAIAVAETLHYCADIIPKDIADRWRKRLHDAAEFVYREFDLHFTNINYGITALYALNFIGRELSVSKYVERSRALAKGVAAYFTKPNRFIFGEVKPSKAVSAKNLEGVDLGYNVEETLNGLVQYAILEKDEALLALADKSMTSHLSFMMPDGAWDNSWGTRQAKWSYWGSRTTDGCQIAFTLMASRNPAFGSAAYRNTALLKRCTHDKLLHGGLHYRSHGVLPCIHHTFSHAKALAAILNSHVALTSITGSPPIPQSNASGVKHFPELDVWQGAVGPWRMSLSAYDALYVHEPQQVTGGAIGMLWHEKVGPVCTGSMAKYQLIEANNQQPNPGPDICLTPRIETFVDGDWYSNVYDLKAIVASKALAGRIEFLVNTTLRNANRHTPNRKPASYTIRYEMTSTALTIEVQQSDNTQPLATRFALPIVSPTGEKAVHLQQNEFAISKPEGVVLIAASNTIKVRESKKTRVFNMVPGMEVLVLDVDLRNGHAKLSISLA